MARTIYQWRHFCLSCTPNAYVLTWALTDPGVCPVNASHTLESTAGTIVDHLEEAYRADADGRLETSAYSADPEYTAQWSFRGDDVVTPKRNAGEAPFWNTANTKNNMDPTKAASDDGDGYYLNALNHALFKGQIETAFYDAINDLTEGTMLRKRFRLSFVDPIQIKEGKIVGHNGKGMSSLVHAFVFAPNPQFNPALPHQDDPALANYNPAGFIAKAFTDENPILPGNTACICTAEKASDKVPVGCQIWIEFTYDPTAFTTNDHCTGFAAQMLYMKYNISNGLDV